MGTRKGCQKLVISLESGRSRSKAAFRTRTDLSHDCSNRIEQQAIREISRIVRAYAAAEVTRAPWSLSVRSPKNAHRAVHTGFASSFFRNYFFVGCRL